MYSPEKVSESLNAKLTIKNAPAVSALAEQGVQHAVKNTPLDQGAQA